MLLLLVAPLALDAQRDSARSTLDAVIITAERTRSTLGSATAAVTRIEGADLARVPHTTVADVLRLVPGFATVSFDGLGGDPQLMVRGFYGGGQAEYVILMVDGIAVDQLHTGLVPWDALPPIAAIEAVEVVRGGSSALYGSTAIGAVINIITRREGARRWEVSGGTFGSWRAHAALGGLSVGVDRTDGYRAHAQRTAGRAHGTVLLSPAITATANAHWRDFDEPGPLLESLLDRDRRMSDSIFRFDNTRDQQYALGLDGRRGRMHGSLVGEGRHTDAIRTLPLAPGFGDTKERVVTNLRAAGTVQLDLDNITMGVDVSRGSIDSKYYDVANGDRGDLDASGDGNRTMAALFTQYSAEPNDAVRLTLGSRVDWMHDRFAGASASHVSFSPKLGANIRLTPALHLYATTSRSFKAPTLDQLFDQRSIPVPFPPFSLTTSNRQLNPQYGTNTEAGLYHRFVTLSAYQMDMKDEIDFDVQTLRYVNIGRSRHRGLEIGASREMRMARAFATYSLQAATARSGDNAGKQLKAIPRHTISAGLTARYSIIDFGLVATHVARIFLDDANTRRIPNYTRVDGQIAYRLASAARLTLEVANLFDAEYSSTGFPDPSGGSEAYSYPAAGRALRVGMRHGW